MKKILGLLVLAAGLLALPAISQAQFYDTRPCNAAPSGKIAHTGEIKLRARFNAHYETQGGKKEDTDIEVADMIAKALNLAAGQTNDDISFASVKWDEDPNNFNLTFYFELYGNDDGTYNVYLSVNGWGEGHLFNIHNTNQKDLATGLADVVARAEEMLYKGWKCSN